MESKLSIEDQWKKISCPIKICYGIILAIVVFDIGFFQGWLTFNNEEDLIELQAEQSCNAIFDSIQRGWTEVKLFSESIAAGFYADNLDVFQSHYTKLSKSLAIKRIAAMESMQFVKHLYTIQELLNYEVQIQAEFETYNADKTLYPWSQNVTWEMFCFINGTACRGTPPFDPIVYQTQYLQTHVFGLFPRPEEPRRIAIEKAMESGIVSCGGAIDLFGVVNWPRGILCYQALYEDSNGKAVPTVNMSAAVYGFVNPVFQISKMLENILQNVDSTKNIVTFLYEVTTGDVNQPNDLYLGQYPTLSMDKWDISKDQTENQHTSGFKTKFSDHVDVGGRDWKIICGVKDQFFNDKTTYLPYYIALLSVGITIGFKAVRIGIKYCVAHTHKGMSKSRYSQRSSKVSHYST